MRQCADEGKTAILVTHDEEVTEMADHISCRIANCSWKQTEENRLLRRRRRLKRYLPIISTGTVFREQKVDWRCVHRCSSPLGYWRRVR
ncbi:MAG: hypothetical protein ACLVJ6_14605 [Merdibacter sp.]